MLAKCGIQVMMSDLFGVEGTELLDRLRLPAPYAARIASLRRLMNGLDFEIDLFTNLVRGQLRTDPGYTAVQQIPGIGPILGAVFVAEVGDVTRFSSVPQLACWAGLTPKHHESDAHVRRGRITSRDPGWSARRRWTRSNASAHTPRSAPYGTGSRPAGAATSARSRPPDNRSSTSSTRYATAMSAHSSTQHGSRHDRLPKIFRSVAGRAGHAPTDIHGPRRGRAF